MFCYLKLYIMFIYICRKNTLKENIMEYIKKNNKKNEKKYSENFYWVKKLLADAIFRENNKVKTRLNKWWGVSISTHRMKTSKHTILKKPIYQSAQSIVYCPTTRVSQNKINVGQWPSFSQPNNCALTFTLFTPSIHLYTRNAKVNINGLLLKLTILLQRRNKHRPANARTGRTVHFQKQKY